MACTSIVVLLTGSRSENLRIHIDSEPGTSFEMSDEACTLQCVATHLSSRNVCHRKSLRNIHDKKETARIREMVRMSLTSTPSRYRTSLQRRSHSCREDWSSPARDSSAEN